jgi:hypothetical protein
VVAQNPCIVSAMTLLLSPMYIQRWQHHGYLLSLHDDSFLMQRRELTIIEMIQHALD